GARRHLPVVSLPCQTLQHHGRTERRAPFNRLSQTHNQGDVYREHHRSLRCNQRQRRFGLGSFSYSSTRAGGSLRRTSSFRSAAKDARSISGRHGRAQILQRLRTAFSPKSASPSLPILVSLTLACVQSVSTSRACVISWYISPYSCRTVAE